MLQDAMRQRLEWQQAKFDEQLTSLASQWEQRFTSLEQALNKGLEMAATTTTSMNDRLAKFMNLAGVLENAVERAVNNSKEVASLGKKVGVIQDDVACLAQELASEKVERSKAVADVAREAE